MLLVYIKLNIIHQALSQILLTLFDTYSKSKHRIKKKILYIKIKNQNYITSSNTSSQEYINQSNLRSIIQHNKYIEFHPKGNCTIQQQSSKYN